ncbi:hypothetical protein EDD18DRAFT_55201 [Armillaria luteobubalina]|uniref:Uncharacterized protein n=1 Tax=Armillaria luteobubalina TaxID=153913 RepID=A0AA39QAF2_9AGAR|nr:hypothetical protein EDD18DRAFT_55201 [Armillaria luteobubalina]
MCNPPFYTSLIPRRSDAASRREGYGFKCCNGQSSVLAASPADKKNRTGAPVEIMTPGGEAAFVWQIVRESKQLGTRCR